MTKHFYKLLTILVFTAPFFSCTREPDAPIPAQPVVVDEPLENTGFPENFEQGSKGLYAAGNVAFGSGTWVLTEALVGTSKSDQKNGSAAVRIRNLGKLTMQFDVSSGAGIVNVKHAKYGSDGNSTWELWASGNSGSSWTQVGSTVTTSSTKLNNQSFTPNLPGPVRFEIRKTGAGASRLNIDDISIEEYVPVVVAAGFPENFEVGSKSSYASGIVSLGSGIWNLNEALIGTSASDNKNGNAAIRIREMGTLTMQFDVPNGAGTVTVTHAKFGSDANSTWELWASGNSGSSWSQIGNTVTSASTALAVAIFTVNLSGNVRLEIRKTGGGANRINIDDFSITSYGPAGGGGSGGGGSGTSSPDDNTHLALGNPSGATSNTVHINNYLMQKPQFDLAYSRDRGTPNWVAWHVNSTWLGTTPRQDDFRADIAVPSGWYQAGSGSYTGSGFDRGHNCPSADRTLTIADNSATFLMSNMIPQAPYNNQQTWGNLEDYTRKLVSQGNEVYVLMGSYGIGGSGSNGSANTINGGLITVPNRVWKVLVVLPNGNGDVSRVSTTTRVIAVDTPNSNNISSSWGTYRTSVDAIETATGYDILSNVPASVQSVLEARVDNGPTN